MRPIDRDISFSVSHPLARRFVPDVGPVWSANFSGGIYVLNGGPAAPADLISILRASNALMAVPGGAYQTFAPDSPPIIAGAGLDIWGQYDNFILSPTDFASADWTNTHVTTADVAAAPDGSQTADLLMHDGTTSGCYAQQISGGFMAGAPNAGVLHVKNYNSVTSHFQLRSPPTTLVDVDIHWDGPVISGIDINQGGGLSFSYTELANGWYRFEAPVTLPVGNANDKFYFQADSDRAGRGVYAWGAMLAESAIVPPYAEGTRYATNVTAPDFLSLVSAYGLDGGFTVGARVTLDRLGENVARCLWVAGTDADNHVRLDITAADTALFTLRKAGTDMLMLESGIIAETGDKDIAVTAKDGGWALAATGVTGDSDAGTYGLPTLSGFRCGSQFGDVCYLNGTMKSLVIGRSE